MNIFLPKCFCTDRVARARKPMGRRASEKILPEKAKLGEGQENGLCLRIPSLCSRWPSSRFLPASHPFSFPFRVPPASFSHALQHRPALPLVVFRRWGERTRSADRL